MTDRQPASSGRHLLYVATVSVTVRNFLVPLAEHFRARGWRVDAAARGATGDETLRRAFDDLYDLPLSRSILDIGGIVAGYRKLAAILDAQPDIVHVHSPIASFLTRLAVRRLPAGRRPAVVYTAHGFHFHRGGRLVTNAVFLLAEKLAGRWTDRLIVINEEDLEAARRYRIVGPGRLVRMPGIGVDTERYARSSIDPGAPGRVRQELRLRPDSPMFVVVAELSPNKRHADIIEALARMEHGATLVIAGEGPQRHRLEALTIERGLHNRVRFAGQVADVRPLVAAATAVVLASDREGLSRALMEALALEVPVIASTARGNRELVRDSGRLFPTRDIRELVAAMDWFVDHPEERQAMGRRGRQRMCESYDLREVIRLHEELYASLTASRRASGP